MKQFTPWRVRQLHGGRLEWTSPLGRVYVDEPPAPVSFVPARGPDVGADCHRHVDADDAPF